MRKRIFEILFLFFLVILLGCEGPPERKVREKPELQGLTVRDLGSQYDFRKGRSKSRNIIEISFVWLEMPADKIGSLIDITRHLSKENIELFNEEIFYANDFAIHFGQVEQFEEVANALAVQEAKENKITNMVINEQFYNEIELKNFEKEKTIFYNSEYESLEGISQEGGSLALRLRVKVLKEQRGAAKLKAVPVYLPAKSRLPDISGIEENKEYPFTDLGFSADMAVGDFVMMTPTSLHDDQGSLNGIFFYNPESDILPPKPAKVKSGEEDKPGVIRLTSQSSINVFIMFLKRIG